MKSIAIALTAATFLGASPPAGQLEVQIESLRNHRGVIQACLGSNPRFFPDCSRDPAAFRTIVAANAPRLRFTGIAPGRYVLTLFHDENTNRRLDMLLGIPREGFGFSRNPKVRFGAPKFKQVDIEIGPSVTRGSVRMQYLL